MDRRIIFFSLFPDLQEPHKNQPNMTSFLHKITKLTDAAREKQVTYFYGRGRGGGLKEGWSVERAEGGRGKCGLAMIRKWKWWVSPESLQSWGYFITKSWQQAILCQSLDWINMCHTNFNTRQLTIWQKMRLKSIVHGQSRVYRLSWHVHKTIGTFYTLTAAADSSGWKRKGF